MKRIDIMNEKKISTDFSSTDISNQDKTTDFSASDIINAIINDKTRIFTKAEIDKQREIDREELSLLWDKLESEAGEENGEAIKEAFKKLYTLYSPGLADWFSKLYDPEVGGYYATTSGHDTEGFGPDVEATIQSLRFIEQSGMIRKIGDASILTALPDDMKAAIVRFTKGLQHENGYFYHPQWTFNDVHYNLSRRGRDLGFATGILNWFGAKPTYDAPNGTAGDGLDAYGKPVGAASRDVCANCGGSTETATAVSDKEKGGSEGAKKKTASYPEYLENRQTFEKYLDGFELRTRSYWYGNQLNATHSQIKARAEALLAEGADYDLCELLINKLNAEIDPNTGYWGAEAKMAGSNGFFKIITLYNLWGYPYPMPERVTESILSSIMGDEIPDGNCCSVYNLWCAVSSIKRNVRKTCSAEVRDRVITRINDILRERGAEAILNTYKKMAPFRKGDVFSGQYVGCGGSQQTLYVGLNSNYGVTEGNVDATCICSTGLIRCMFDAFEFERVPMLSLADWMVYRNNLLTYGGAKKIRVLDPELSFSASFIPNVTGAFGEGSAEIEDGVFTGRICEDGGFRLAQTARIPKGDYKLFEADLAISELTGDKTVLVSTFVGGSEIRGSGFFTMKFGEGEVTLENRKWEKGFISTHKLSGDSLKLRVELYLANKAQKAAPGTLSSAARVFVNGELAGEYVNDDGTEKAYPSGININNENLLLFTGYGNTCAKISLRGYRFSYYTES